jgi:DNA-binding MarR family transcriptional regulator
MHSATNLFLRIWLKWRSELPPALVKEDPRLLIRLLQLGSLDAGVSQSGVQRELAVNQPRLSKLMRKLIREEWISVEKSETDGRLATMRTTQAAQDWLATLEEGFTESLAASELGSARSHKKSRSPKPETYSLLPAFPKKHGRKDDEGGAD